MRLAPLLALTVASASPSCRGEAAGRPAAPDDLSDLAATLRPETLAGLERQLGIASLADVPLWEVDLAVDATGGAFAGRATLRFRNPTGKPLAALPLVLHANAPAELGASQSSSVTLSEARAEEGPEVRLEVVRPTLARLVFATPLAPGARARVRMRFTGTLRALPASANDPFDGALAALGATGPGSVPDYGLLGRGDGLVTLVSPIPLVAPRRGEGFAEDLPARIGDLPTHDPANFRLRLALPPGYRAVTNLAAETAPTPTPDGKGVVITAAGALRRELAVVASPSLASASCEVGRVRVKSSFLRRDERAGRSALSAACGSLAKLEQMLGPYPYTELDVVESTIVGGAGGVELSSMVLIAGMLYRPPEQSQSRLATLSRMLASMESLMQGLDGEEGGLAKAKNPLADTAKALDGVRWFTVVHEVAHQWFAGLVGADSQQDACFDEPLAQFLAVRILEELEGEQAAREALAANVRTNYVLFRTLGGADGAADRPSASFRSNLEYAALVYGKAPHFYLVLREKLGAARFDKALKSAVAAHRFQRVSLKQWLATLEKAAGGGVAPLARRWFEEAHGDEDLKVDPDGDEIFEQMFGAELAPQVRETLGAAGLSPKALLRMLLGGAMGEAGEPPGPLIDPAELLRSLEGGW